MKTMTETQLCEKPYSCGILTRNFDYHQLRFFLQNARSLAIKYYKKHWSCTELMGDERTSLDHSGTL